MKKIIVFIAFVLMTLAANASKSTGAVHIFQQPDGTNLSVQLLGDEYFSWHQTTDGILLAFDDNAYYIAATDSLGNLINSGVLAHNAEARTDKEVTAIKRQDRTLFFSGSPAVTKAKARRKAIAGYPASNYCPHSGTVRVPIIMMAYSDMSFTLSDKSVWDEYFNGTTRTPHSTATRFQGYSSVKQYFADASQGQLNFEFDIYGPYTADNNHDYYGKINGDYRELSLLKEAVRKADADIDFTQYDSNNDGCVDMVYILYAGTGANLSGNKNDFWPACWTNAGSITSADGKTINVIGGANELMVTAAQQPTLGNLRAGIGVTCHEMSHGLGLPDLYWTLDNAPKDAQGHDDWNNCGPEDWDLMDGGENLFNAAWPCQYTAWERDVMGWLNTEELTEPQTVTLLPLNKQGGKACRVTNPANKNEYYIIENYQGDEWNQYLNNQYGTGLMITHLNMDGNNALSMTPNNTYGKPNITILPADDFILALYSIGKKCQYKEEVQTITKNQYIADTQGDPYAGTKSPSPLNHVTAYKNYTGEDMVNTYPITDITRNNDGSITFRFMGGATGDANDDGITNILDITTTTQHILTPSVNIKTKAADTNGDGKITTDDIKGIKDIILNK